MIEKKNFTLINKTRWIVPSVPFAKMKDEALGKDYSLSLVFIGENTSRRLNFTYGDENKATNVLSFPLDKKSGEIFIAPAVVKRQTKLFGRKFENLTFFLFIHGLMHLKGHKHGDTMEKAEKKLRKVFSV